VAAALEANGAGCRARRGAGQGGGGKGNGGDSGGDGGDGGHGNGAAVDFDFAVGGNDGSPTVLAFLGPSGVGKTELAKAVAAALHGEPAEILERSGKLKRLAMNQYGTASSVTNLLGADKGLVGQCGGLLTSALRAVPDAVIVLDEFEKAHGSFAESLFLNAFGADGFLADSCADNARVRTGRATFIITSNFASEALLLPAAALGPGAEASGAFDAAARAASGRAEAARREWAWDPAGRRNPFLRPEARGRVDAFVPFFPYPHGDRLRVASRALAQALLPVERRFAPSLRCCWTPAAAAHFVGKYDEAEGLRPVVNALGDLSALLAGAHRIGTFDPRTRGTVILLDVDYDDSGDGGDDYGAGDGGESAGSGRLVVRSVVLGDGDFDDDDFDDGDLGDGELGERGDGGGGAGASSSAGWEAPITVEVEAAAGGELQTGNLLSSSLRATDLPAADVGGARFAFQAKAAAPEAAALAAAATSAVDASASWAAAADAAAAAAAEVAAAVAAAVAVVGALAAALWFAHAAVVAPALAAAAFALKAAALGLTAVFLGVAVTVAAVSWGLVDLLPNSIAGALRSGAANVVAAATAAATGCATLAARGAWRGASVLARWYPGAAAGAVLGLAGFNFLRKQRRRLADAGDAGRSDNHPAHAALLAALTEARSEAARLAAEAQSAGALLAAARAQCRAEAARAEGLERELATLREVGAQAQGRAPPTAAVTAEEVRGDSP